MGGNLSGSFRTVKPKAKTDELDLEEAEKVKSQDWPGSRD